MTWLNALDLFIAFQRNPERQSDDDYILMIGQIVDNTWHSTEFIRIPIEDFPIFRYGDWYITASDEEKYALSCLFDQSLPARLEVNAGGRVAFTGGTPSRLRDEPGLIGQQVALLPEGAAFNVIGGPACTNGYRWWQLALADGTVGWAAEGDAEAYFLEPVSE